MFTKQRVLAPDILSQHLRNDKIDWTAYLACMTKRQKTAENPRDCIKEKIQKPDKKDTRKRKHDIKCRQCKFLKPRTCFNEDMLATRKDWTICNECTFNQEVTCASKKLKC